MAEQTELYSQVPSPGENIPVTVEPALIDDSVPTEDKIADAVKKLRRNRSGGGVADSRGAHQGVARGGQEGGVEEEKRTEKTEAEEEGEEMWGKVVEMTQTAFREGKMAEEATWQTVVLIPEGKGEFQGIGMVDPPNAKEAWRRMKGWYQAAA